MTNDRAIEINRMCYAHILYREGVREELPPSLEDISLPDMLEATKIVEGIMPQRMTCDHRLLAALYVAYHYQADEGEIITSIAISCIDTPPIKIGRFSGKHQVMLSA